MAKKTVHLHGTKAFKNTDANQNIIGDGKNNTVNGLGGKDSYDGGKGNGDKLIIHADWADAKITETKDGFKIKVGSDVMTVKNVEKFVFDDGSYTKKTLINHAPTGTPKPLTAGTEDTDYTITAAQLLKGIKDSDKDALSVSGLKADNGATITDNHDGTYTIHPAADFNGTLNLSYKVTDARGASIKVTNTLDIAPVNDTPEGTATPLTAHGTEDTAYTVSTADLTAGFTDKDGDALSVTGLTADHGTVTANPDGTFTITPDADYNGLVTLTYKVTDGTVSVDATNSFTVDPVNDAPVVATPISDATGSEGVAFSFVVPAGTFTDVDGDTLTLSATLADGSDLPAWLTFDATTGTFTGTPPDGAGTVSVKVTASDGSLTASDTFDIVVADTIKTLTTANDTLGLTSATETINGDSTTFNAGDLIVDTTVGDNDTLNVTLTGTNATATVAGIENVNFTWDALTSAVIDATNIKGASITVGSTKFGFAGGLTVNGTGNNSVTAGTGVTGTLDVNGATATTVNTGSASTVTVDGSGVPADNTSAVVNAGDAATSITVGAVAGFLSTTVNGGAATQTIAVSNSADVTIVGSAATTTVTVGDKGAADKASITLSSDATVTASGAETLNITEAAGKTITLGGNLANASTTTITSGGAVTLVATQANLNLANNTKLVNATSDLTLKLGSITAAMDLTNIGFNTLDLNGNLAANLTVASGVTVLADAGELNGKTLLSTTGTSDVLNLKLTGANSIDVTDGTKDIETLHVTTALASGTQLAIASLDVLAATFAGADKLAITAATASSLDFSAVTGDVTVSALAAQTGVTSLSVSGSATAANTVTFNNGSESLIYVGGAGVDNVTVSNSIVAASSFTLGDGDNIFTANTIGNGGSVSISSGAGVDTITLGFDNTASGSAAAVVAAGGGNDVINVSFQNAMTESVSISGEAGDDTLTLSSLMGANHKIIYDGGAGTDVFAIGGVANDISGQSITLTNVEVIRDVSVGKDSIVGAELLSGKTYTIQNGTGDVADLLDVKISTAGTYNFSGLTLDNTVDHAIGGLSITGSIGVDTITGTSGKDVIAGGAGADILTGGLGADAFVFTDATTKDTITDFTVSQGDKLRFDIGDLVLNAADYSAATSGTAIDVAGATTLGAGNADKHVIVDTAAHIATFADASNAWSGAVIAIATDTGNIIYDANGDFTSTGDQVVIGSITPAQALLLTGSSFDFVA